MHIELPNCHVAVRNNSDVSWGLQYDGKVYQYPAVNPKTGKPGLAIVPFEIAHQHFGFELDDKGNLFRNTEADYPDGEETAYYSARANILPWIWMTDRALAKTKMEDEDGNELDVTYGQEFRRFQRSFEKGITGKLVKAPAVISEEQYNSLPDR